jgi:hypothetical protein
LNCVINIRIPHILLSLHIVLISVLFPLTDLDGDQPVVFYYIDPGHALERHAGKLKFRNKFYYQYQREESWTRPGVRAFGRVNGGLAFQGFQKIAGNAVPLCHVLYADKAGSTKHCSHHPIYGEFAVVHFGLRIKKLTYLFKFTYSV